MKANNDVKVNRTYKDSLFRKIFGEDKKAALSLYNAVNESAYNNPEDLEFTTLDDVIYMKMKNDVSFIFSTITLNLYEHQSSFNPNMPLRGFLYFADLYRQLYASSESLYGSKMILLPTPRYVVFYNGDDKKMKAERSEMRLSSAFEDSSARDKYEWTADVINVNYGKNKGLMEKCRPLEDYSKFVQRVRDNEISMNLKDALDEAVEYSIKNDILKDFLKKHQREVKNMSLTEFDENKFKEVMREEGKAFAIFELVEQGDLEPQKGAKALKMDLPTFEKHMTKNGYALPTLA